MKGTTSRRTTHRQQRPGFTLMETILAVALSTLLIAMIGAGMRIYTRVVADRRADVVNAQLARVVLQHMSRDIQRAFLAAGDEEDSGDISAGDETSEDIGDTTDPIEDDLDTTLDLTGSTVQPTPGLYGNQFELQIDVLGQFAKPVKFDALTMAGVDPIASNLLSDPKVITYYLRAADSAELAGTPLQSVEEEFGQRTVLIRRVQSRAAAIYATTANVSDIQSGEQMLSDQVVSVEFAYHDGYDWLDSWDSSIMGGLPVAVSITLTVVDEANTDNSTDTELTGDNIYQLTVRIPTVEPVVEDTGI